MVNPRPRRIVVVGFERAQLLDIAGPPQVFASATALGTADGRDGYEVILVSPAGGTITTSAGIGIATAPLATLVAGEALPAAPPDTLIVVGGPGVHDAAALPALVEGIAALAGAARRVCSVCTGAFLLASTGLLDGRRAVTHWASCDLLQARFPAIRVEADPIFIRDRPIWSSAGVTAGIDLALALVEEDFGHALAMQVARHLVVFLKRPGGQSQFSAPLRAQTAGDATLDSLHAWMESHLDGDLRVERLAAQAGLSPRHFARAYAAKLGTTPAKTVEAMRVEAARRALEAGTAPIKQIAHQSGFGDEERMRRAFLRRLGVNPSDYRQRFAR